MLWVPTRMQSISYGRQLSVLTLKKTKLMEMACNGCGAPSLLEGRKRPSKKAFLCPTLPTLGGKERKQDSFHHSVIRSSMT